MISKERIKFLKELANEESFYNNVLILELIEHIEHLEDINDGLVHECETWEAKYIREEEQEMSRGNA
jgi:hypothetical protein